MKGEKKNVIPFQNEFNHLSPNDIDNILESLRDYEYLSERGEQFREDFGNLFIKQDYKTKLKHNKNYGK